jgi:hypothetical protein
VFLRTFLKIVMQFLNIFFVECCPWTQLVASGFLSDKFESCFMNPLILSTPTQRL